MQKLGVVIYHSNILNIYKPRWIIECISSLLNQTVNDFTIYEINYDGENNSVVPPTCPNERKFFALKLKNHAQAMNFIIEQAFNDDCEIVFNVNLDDIYHPTRFEKQIKAINDGYDLVSSDFCYIEEINDSEDIPTMLMNIANRGDINENLKRGHNVIAHPSVCYSKNFWRSNKYNPDLIPREDLDLWQRSCDKFKFHIIDEVLLNYRIHSNQVSKS